MKTRQGNGLCSCGSQKKYKHCCLGKENISLPHIEQDKQWLSLRACERSILEILKCYVEKELGSSIKEAAQEVFSIFEEFNVDFDLHQGVFDHWFLFSWHIEIEMLPHLNDSYEEMTIAEACLVDHPELFDLYQTTLICAICSSPFSFYLVRDVIPERRLILKDILLNKEITVKESEGTKGVEKGSILFCRPVTLDEQSIILGLAPRSIPNRYFSDVVNIRRQLRKELHPPVLDSRLLLDLDFELRDYYFQLLEHAFQPIGLSNTDGKLITPLDSSYLFKNILLKETN